MTDQDPLEPVTRMPAQLARTERTLLDEFHALAVELHALKASVEYLPQQFPKPLEPARPKPRFWPFLWIAVFCLCIGAGIVLALFWWVGCGIPTIRPLAAA